MKIRSGFVSNSSSSSFIIISGCCDQTELEFHKNIVKANEGKLVVDGTRGTCEFGWENDCYTDFYSKLNFAYLQYLYVRDEHPEWLGMLEDVLGDELGVMDIDWVLQTDKYNEPGYAYIDHQSASIEDSNTEMFDSVNNLRAFLFSKDSYIQGGNDNDF